MHPKKNTCSHKINSKVRFKPNTPLSILSGLVIAIIPKCPFCIMAYSSAVTLCSGKTMYLHHTGWTSYISILLAVFTLLMILLNYRGRRTIVAAFLVIIGSVFIIQSELYTGNIPNYYCGVILLLFGVWMNASFVYVKNKFLKKVFRFSEPSIKES